MIVSSRANAAKRPINSLGGNRLRLLPAVGGTVMALGLSGPALADAKAGVDAWAKGDYAGAVREWEGPASHGEPAAQFDLGQAYKMGRGVKQDLARAEELFGQAAAQGHMQAADEYGILLFQRGEHDRAMPYVAGAATRGDPRAEYLLGIAHFNGENVPKDWVRAYALVSLAQESGLPPAKAALVQMDTFIPLEQRQQAVALKADLSQQIEATRNRQVASVELGTTLPHGSAGPLPASGSSAPQRPYSQPAYSQPAYSQTGPTNRADPYSGFPPSGAPQPASADSAPPAPYQTPAYSSAPQRASQRASQLPGALAATSGEARPVGLPPRPVDLPRKHPRPAATPLADAQPRPAPAPAPSADETTAPTHAPAHAASGPWKIQLGAFGVPANAEALWARAKGRPEIAGHPRALVPTGKVRRLLATGYSEGAAHAACAKLTAAGLVCIVTKD